MPEEKYRSLPTHLEGIELRIVLANTEPEVPKTIIWMFYKAVRGFVVAKRRIERLNSLLKERKQGILKFVEAVNGLRGARSLRDDFSLLAVQKEKTVFERTLLKESLGPIYSQIVSEDLCATISIPPGVISEEDLRVGLNGLLVKLGIDARDLPKIIQTDITMSIDIEKLNELVQSGRTTLLPGTRESEKEWVINVDPLREKVKPKKLKTAKK